MKGWNYQSLKTCRDIACHNFRAPETVSKLANDKGKMLRINTVPRAVATGCYHFALNKSAMNDELSLASGRYRSRFCIGATVRGLINC